MASSRDKDVLFKIVFEKELIKPKETAINNLIMSRLKRLS